MYRLGTLAVIAIACGRINFADRTDGGDGGGDGGDGGPGAACNSVTRFFDDFEDGVRDDVWSTSYAEGAATVTEVGGDAVLTLASNSVNTYCGYSTGRLYDLREHRMVGEVAQTPNTGAEMGLAAQYDQTQYLHLYVQNGMIGATQSVMGTFTNLGAMPFDPVANRFVAIEEHAGQVLFETSPDGVMFTSFLQAAEPFDLSLIRPQLFAGTFTAVATPGVARWASFNRAVPAEGACSVSSLSDDFNDGVQGHLWENSYAMPCCTISESAGALHVATNGTPGFAALQSSAGYDLRNGNLSIELPAGPSGPDMLASLRIDRDMNNSIELQVHASSYSGLVVIAGTQMNLATVARPVGQNFVMLEESGGMISFKQSTDRMTWMTTHTFPTPFTVDDVRVVVQGGIGGATTRPADSAAYDTLLGAAL